MRIPQFDLFVFYRAVVSLSKIWSLSASIDHKLSMQGATIFVNYNMQYIFLALLRGEVAIKAQQHWAQQAMGEY